jgi:hypothetical protein
MHNNHNDLQKCDHFFRHQYENKTIIHQSILLEIALITR